MARSSLSFACFKNYFISFCFSWLSSHVRAIHNIVSKGLLVYLPIHVWWINTYCQRTLFTNHSSNSNRYSRWFSVKIIYNLSFFSAETISSRKLARASNVTKRFVKMSRRESNLSRTVFLQNRVVSCIFSHQIIDFFYSPIFPPTAKNVAKMPTKKSANANNCRTLNVSKITAIFLQQKCSSQERLTLRMELWH